MKIEEFIPLIFNNDIDKYPMIRESILKNWNVKEMLVALGKSEHKVSLIQLEKFIKFIEGSNTVVNIVGSAEDVCSEEASTTTIIYPDGLKYIQIYPYPQFKPVKVSLPKGYMPKLKSIPPQLSSLFNKIE